MVEFKNLMKHPMVAGTILYLAVFITHAPTGAI
ncbi:hypothetical protein Ga0123462_1542 [Mariprofundus ferrinatatus]|uniref:Uncharacterized protein n=1 Tax=Mariprofundus ferrinatatus TaxID=1921087 RepID=A0A2K8L506_9PROT|nr:hypothetical protein Ga0123462_1542 [Mariprofundus ferrinatatus]